MTRKNKKWSYVLQNFSCTVDIVQSYTYKIDGHDCRNFNPKPAEFLKWNNQPSLFWSYPLLVLGISKCEIVVGKPVV